MDRGCKDALDRIASHIQNVIGKAGLTLETIDSVEVIGGGMRIPAVQAKVKESIGEKELCFTLDSAHCVATGSALLAKTLNPEFEFAFEVVDSFHANADISKLSPELIEKSSAKLAEFLEHDRLISHTREKKNELESFIYTVRNKTSNPSLAEVIQASEKEVISKVLETTENWIYDEGEEADLIKLESKLKDLKDSVASAAPKLHERMVKEEEERKKIEEEEREARKNFVPSKSDRDDKEPRTKGEKIDAAKKRKHQGAVCFKDGDIEGAALRWTQALGYFESVWDLSEDQKKEINEIKLPCYLNLAMCFLKLKKYEKARDNCTEALKIEGENVKALYRRGQAYYYLKDFEEAKKDLTLAAKLEPKDNEVKKTLKLVTDQVAAQKEKEKKIYGKMFGGK